MSNEFKTSKSLNSTERVYNFICSYIRENGISPSVRDICTGSGLKSTSSVHGYLKKLVELGKIEYRPGLRRAIVVKNLPGNDDEETDNLTNINFSNESFNNNLIQIPCIGKITAGIPILAHEDYSDSIFVDKSIIGNSEAFILKVKGTSMINAHILDGDLIIIKKQNTCNEGDIIAALIGDEATVKRFGYLNGEPYLFPENDLYSPIPFNTEECKILGKVVGLHRYSI